MVNAKPKRNKAMTILLFPILICLFIIGFCLYCLGERKRTSEIQHKPYEKDNVSIIPMVKEDAEEVIYS